MVSTKHETPDSATIIEILSQTIGNPIVLGKTDFMIGIVCDQQGNVQTSTKKMALGANYYFLAYDESTSKTNDGLPNYSNLPKYVIPFELKKFSDKYQDTIYTWLRAGINAFSTIIDAGLYAQDQSEGLIKSTINYDKADKANCLMHIGSYIKDGYSAFVMSIVSK